jgi:NAD-reducing hydrogenase large subunit
MSRRIVIQPVTRIEGHAKVSIQLDDQGKVQNARFHVTEFRGFEKLCLGRPFHEMPGLMSRVCGICPVSHVLASSKAGDVLLGVSPPPAAVKQRRLANYAQILQSHALSFFHLSAPDLLLGMDAPPAMGSIFGLLESEREFARRGIRLRQFGQRVIELTGGKRIHPAWSGPGGVHRAFPREARDEILTWIPEAIASAEFAIDRLKRVLDRFHEEIEHMGSFASLFLATVNPQNTLEYYEGTLRLADSRGNTVAESLDPKRYFTYLEESSETWTFTKFPFFKPLGPAAGSYRVGPLARLNLARAAGTPRADRELREFKQRSQGAVSESFQYHLARLVEILHCAERIEEAMDDPELFGDHFQAKAWLNHQEGAGSCEAPRGTLFHRYQVDGDGLVTGADLLIATAQNNRAINLAVEQTARRFLDPLDAGAAPSAGILNRIEAAIRCYDPCLSCSTHALGNMPLVVEIIDGKGRRIHEIAREIS